MHLIVLAGGLGTRSQLEVPKLLTNIGDRTVLDFLLVSVSRSTEISKITFLLGHEAQSVVSQIQRLNSISVPYDFVVEKTEDLAGTGGALINNLESFENEFVVVFGDLLVDFDFDFFIRFSKAKKTDLVIACHPNGHSFDSDSIEFSSFDGSVEKIFLKKGEIQNSRSIYSMAGIWYFKKQPLTKIVKDDILINAAAKIDLVGDIIYPNLTYFHSPLAFPTLEYIKDIGTPTRRSRGISDVDKNLLFKRSRRYSKPALFLDRDNTLIKDSDGAISLILANQVGIQINQLNEVGIPVLVMSNQSRAAKGISIYEIDKLHNKIDTILEASEAWIDLWYWCPHYPPEDRLYFDEVAALKVFCDCRKPNAGLLYLARRHHNLDLARSYFVGDSEDDFLACSKAGVSFLHTTEFKNQKCVLEIPHLCFKATSDALAYARSQYVD